MPLIYKIYGSEKDLVFWNPYLSIIYAPKKNIDNRYFSPKIMLTIGRELKSNINKEEFDKLPENIRKKFEKEIKKGLTKSLIKFIKNIYIKTAKLFGSNVEIDKKKFQIFEYIKYEFTAESKEKYENMLYGLAIGYGLIGASMGFLPSEMKQRLYEILNRGVDIGVKKWQTFQ